MKGRKVYRLKAITVMIAMIISLFGIIVVSAPKSVEAAASYFSDDFEDGNSDGWTATAGTWSVVDDSGNKVYRQSNTSSSVFRSVAGEAGWTDYSVEAKIKYEISGDVVRNVGINARYTDADNYYYANYDANSNTIYIGKKVAGTTTNFQSKSKTLNPNTTYTFKFKVSGSSLKLYIDGVEELSENDGSLASGKIGMFTYKQTAKFDDVLVSAISPLPTVTVDCSSSLGTYTRTEKYNQVALWNDVSNIEAGDIDKANELDTYLVRGWMGANHFYNTTTKQYDYTGYPEYFELLDSMADRVLLCFEHWSNVGHYDVGEYKQVTKNGLIYAKQNCPKLEYIECLNEANSHGTSIEDYYEYYQIFYQVVNEINDELDPTIPLKLGGPVTNNYNSYWISSFINAYAADQDPNKRLDFISYHHYLPNNNESNPNSVSNQKSTIQGWLSAKSLSTDLPIFISETGNFPATKGSYSFDRDILTQAAGMASMHYCYTGLGDGIYPVQWVMHHATNKRKDIMAPTEGVFSPYGNMLKMKSLLKDERVAVTSDTLTSEGIGVYGFGTKDDTGVAAMTWNYQWTDQNVSYTGGTWSNYTVEAKVRPIAFESNARIGIAARYNGESENYAFVYDNATGKIAIQSIWRGQGPNGENGIICNEETESVDYDIDINSTYVFKAEVNGTSLSFYVWKDGETPPAQPQLTATRTSLSTGKIALIGDFAKVAFDDVKVIDLADSSVDVDDNFEDGNSTGWGNQGGDWSVGTIDNDKMYIQSKLPMTYTTTANINNLPSIFDGKNIKVEKYLIDSTHSNYRYDAQNANLQKVEDIVIANASSYIGQVTLEPNALALVVLTPTTQSPGTPTPLFRDDFEDGNADGWSAVTGTWSVEDDSGNDVYRQSNTTSIVSRSVAGEAGWTDYSVEAKIKYEISGDVVRNVGINARYIDANNYYFANYDANSNTIYIGKKVAGATTNFQSKSKTLNPNTAYKFKFEVSGSTLKLYIDDVEELSETDASLASGKIGLYTYKQTAKFDDVLVTGN